MLEMLCERKYCDNVGNACPYVGSSVSEMREDHARVMRPHALKCVFAECFFTFNTLST